MNTTYNFEVKSLEAGQRGKYQDSFYSYEVTSTRSEQEVRRFCMKVLRRSHEPKHMPNAFAGKLLEFKKLTDNNKGKSMLAPKEPETYLYRTTELYTG